MKDLRTILVISFFVISFAILTSGGCFSGPMCSPQESDNCNGIDVSSGSDSSMIECASTKRCGTLIDNTGDTRFMACEGFDCASIDVTMCKDDGGICYGLGGQCDLDAKQQKDPDADDYLTAMEGCNSLIDNGIDCKWLDCCSPDLNCFYEE